MFTHLHVHTQYSLLEGAIKIPNLIKALKVKNFRSCAITDHGNMFGVMEFYHAMKSNKLKPIVGMGAFISNKEIINTSYRRFAQTQLICKNRIGYKNLTYIAAESFNKGKQFGVPTVSHSSLEKLSLIHI